MNEFNSVDCKFLEYKKIAKRFLKELGLYNAWLIYLGAEKAIAYKKSWYKKYYIDSIFGETLFTSFLHKAYGVRLEATISDIFRYYLIKNSINYVLNYPLRDCYIKEIEKVVDIDKCTGKISFKKVIWKNSIGNETGN